MGRIITITLYMLVFSSFLLIGCSSKTDSRFQKRGDISADFPRDRQFQFNRSMNLTEEERQQMMEERQQQMIESCEGKNEGDNCQFEERKGDVNGICKIMDENLVCTINRATRQRRE